MSHKHSVQKSFSHATSGIRAALKQEPNFRTHFVIAILAVLTAWYLNISTTEWLVLLLTITLVMILELINTAIEALIDLISPEIQPKARLAKDVSAAGVLLAAVVALAVGVLIFLPKIAAILQR